MPQRWSLQNNSCGASEKTAIGCWQRRCGTVTLDVTEMANNYGNKKFGKLKPEDEEILNRTGRGKEHRYELLRKF